MLNVIPVSAPLDTLVPNVKFPLATDILLWILVFAHLATDHALNATLVSAPLATLVLNAKRHHVMAPLQQILLFAPLEMVLV